MARHAICLSNMRHKITKKAYNPAPAKKILTIGMMFANNAFASKPKNNVKPMNAVGTKDPSIKRVLLVKRNSAAGDPSPEDGAANLRPSDTRRAK